METITITHRIINGKNIYNKKFDDYEKDSLYGMRISKAEYMESRQNQPVKDSAWWIGRFDIVERFTYNN